MNRKQQSVADVGDTKPAGFPGALVLGGAHGSLAVARSLGRRGIPVWLVTDDHPIAPFSRYLQRSFCGDGAQNEGAVAYLLDLAEKRGLNGWVLFGGGDAEVRLIARHRVELSTAFRVTTPPWSVAQFAYDKRLTHQRAAA